MEELPEPGVKLTPSEWQKHLIGAARSYLKEVVQPAAAFYEQWALIGGNLEAASVRLDEGMYRDNRTPLALYGVHGIDGQGRPYVSVTVLNEHRETAALWLMVQRKGGPLERIRIALPVQQKDPEVILPHWLNILPQSWEEFDKRRSVDNQVVEVHATPDRFVEIPSLADCIIAAGAEDRINGLGNFVVSFEKDEQP